MVLLGALQVLLGAGADRKTSRWQSDRRAHAPEDGRPDRLFPQHAGDAHGPVGRPDVTEELLGRVRDVALGAYTHQELPFEKLVAELQPRAGSLAAGVVPGDVYAAEQAVVIPGIAGVGLEPAALTATTSKFDLSLEFFERDSGLAGSVEYPTDLFDSGDDRAVGRELQGAAGRSGGRRGSWRSELPLLSEAERRQLLEEWNATKRGSTRREAHSSAV